MSENIEGMVKCFEVNMLGEFWMKLEDEELDLKIINSDKVYKLLIYMLIQHEKLISADELIKALWSGSGSLPVGNPGGALKNLIHRLRKILSETWGERDYIINNRGSYIWNPRLPMVTDVECFDDLYQMSERTRRQHNKIAYLEEAIMTYKGEFLPGMNDEEWILSRREHYRLLYQTATERLAWLKGSKN